MAALGNTIAQSITSSFDKMATRFNPVAASEPTAPQEPVRTITQEQVDKAFEEGNYQEGARLQSKMHAETLAINEFRTNQRLAQIEGTGTSLIYSQALQLAKNNPDMPYFSRFENEIKEKMKYVAAEHRAHPDVIRSIYDNVVGAHYRELMQEERERDARQAAGGVDDGGGLPPGGAGTGRDHAKPAGKLTIDSVFGAEAPTVKQRLREVNGGLDAFLKRRGYKDEQEWLQAQKAYRDEQQGVA